MHKKLYFLPSASPYATALVLATMVLSFSPTLSAQSRRASIGRGDSNGDGKCTVEVMVDGAAEIEIRGDSANLRTLSGSPAQWRRFECTGPLPARPIDFRFQGVDGRGRQSLVRDPRSGGVAVVQINDPDNGSEGYTFDMFWRGAGGPGGGPGYGGGPGGGPGYGGPGFNGPGPGGRPGRRFSSNDAIHACEDAITQRASDRFRGSSVALRNSHIDGDRVMGNIEVRRGRDRDNYRFFCSVDFDGRQIRSADFMPDDRH